MRKTLAILISVLMLLPLLYVGAAAAPAVGKVAADYKPDTAATAIADAAAFAAMDPAGNYYLSADITVAATFESDFTGILDGNGKTVTTSVPLFKQFKGTIKNLTVTGTINVTDGYAGAIAINTKGDATYDNIHNTAAITGASTTGGILGYGSTGSNIVITNCVNDGKIEGGSQTGGIVGYIQGLTATIKNCVNNGVVNATKTYGAGIIGRFGRDASTVNEVCTIENCTNNGAVTVTKDQGGGIIGYIVGIGVIKNCVNKGNITNVKGAAGGIVGQTASSDKISGITIDNCFNYGEITATTNAGGIAASMGRTAAATGFKYTATNCGNFGKISNTVLGTGNTYTGGVVGYMYGGSTGNGVFNCFNMGDITVNIKDIAGITADKFTYVAGVMAYFNTSGAYVKNCYNAGKITTGFTDASLLVNQLYMNKSADGAAPEFIANNYALAVEGATYETNGTQAASYKTFTAAELASGKLCYDINTAAGTEIFRQTLNKDKAPTTVAGARSVKLEGTAYVNDTTPPPTGDNAVYFVAIGALALITVLSIVAVPAKKKAE